MSRTNIGSRPEARATYWTAVSAATAEGVGDILAGGEFGKNTRAIDEAVRFCTLSLEGYPLMDVHRSEV